jgi:hypothetical protein
MEMKYTIPDNVISDILILMNEFLPHLSLVTLSRHDADSADPRRAMRLSDKRYSGIERVVNRWGIRCEDGKYYLRLNEIIGRIASCNRMLSRMAVR